MRSRRRRKKKTKRGCGILRGTTPTALLLFIAAFYFFVGLYHILNDSLFFLFCQNCTNQCKGEKGSGGI